MQVDFSVLRPAYVIPTTQSDIMLVNMPHKDDPNKKQFHCLIAVETNEQSLRTRFGPTCIIRLLESNIYICVVPDFKGDIIPDENGSGSLGSFVRVPKTVAWGFRAIYKIGTRLVKPSKKKLGDRDLANYDILNPGFETLCCDIIQQVERPIWHGLGLAIPHNAMGKGLLDTFNTVDAYLTRFTSAPAAAPVQALVVSQSEHARAAFEASEDNYNTDEGSAEDEASPVVAQVVIQKIDVLPADAAVLHSVEVKQEVDIKPTESFAAAALAKSNYAVKQAMASPKRAVASPSPIDKARNDAQGKKIAMETLEAAYKKARSEYNEATNAVKDAEIAANEMAGLDDMVDLTDH